MKETKVTHSYNMDILSFLNVITSDDFYVNYYREDFEHFYPLLSNEVKAGLNALISSTGISNIAPFFTTIISSLDDNNNRDIKEMIFKYDEIDTNMQKSPYYGLYSAYIKMLPSISGLIAQIIEELEANGYREYWEKNKLPLIDKRCKDIEKVLAKNDISEYIGKYKELVDEDIVIYICTFAHPHGTRLYGNVILMDYVWSDNNIMNTVIHELFHPPYKYEEVSDLVGALAKKEFVVEAHKNQNPKLAYEQMDLFIEENIVEALAVYAVVMLGFEEEPYEYFKKHDEGSHVISPYFYNYLKENDIKENQTFKEYFENFVKYLDITIR